MANTGDLYENGRQSLVLDDEHFRGPLSAAESPGLAYLHKPLIALVLGALTSGAGAVLLLMGVSPVGSACLSVGLMFVVLGLVWLPVLKEKHRRRTSALGE
uniref:Uncharacterized protein n=1 Tax=Knipowitschia caucasica TaxID=637954 RepID=A0AAV2LST3_KNICA